MTQRPVGRNPGGRRPGESGTRAAILAAARSHFAERGYDGASLRAIASAAGVDAALIRHFFGDKAMLFAISLADHSSIPDTMAAAFAGDPADVGTRLTRSYLGMWEDAKTRPVLEALVRSSATSEPAADMLSGVIESTVRSATGANDEQWRQIALAWSHLLGLAFARYVLRVRPLADMPLEDLVAQVAPAVQAYLGEARSESASMGSGAPLTDVNPAADGLSRRS